MVASATSRKRNGNVGFAVRGFTDQQNNSAIGGLGLRLWWSHLWQPEIYSVIFNPFFR